MKRWLVLGAGVVAVVAVGGVGLGYLAASHGDQLLAAASRGLGREIRAARIGFTLHGGVGVRLADVTIADDPASGGGPPLLAARAIEMRVALLPLLRRHLVVDRIVLDQPVVNVVREADGRVNLEALRRGHREATGSNEPAAPGPPPARPAFLVGRLRVRDGTVRVTPGPGRTVVVSDLSVDAYEPRVTAPMPVHIQGHVAGEGLVVRRVVVEGTLDLAAEAPRFAGTIEAGPGTFGGHGRRFELERAGLDARSGLVRGTPLPLRVRGRVRGKDLTLDAVVVEGDVQLGEQGPEFRGTVRGGVGGASALSFAKLDAQATAQAGEATTRFVVADGKLGVPREGRVPFAQLEPLLGLGGLERLRARYPDLLGEGAVAFTRCEGTAHLVAQRIDLSDLVIVGPSYEMRGQGRIARSGDVDLSLRLVASQALTDDLVGHRAVLRAALVDGSGRVAIPLHVTGSRRRLHVTPDHEFVARVRQQVLSGALGEGLGQALEGKPGGIEGMVGGVLDKLLHHRRGH